MGYLKFLFAHPTDCKDIRCKWGTKNLWEATKTQSCSEYMLYDYSGGVRGGNKTRLTVKRVLLGPKPYICTRISL